MRTLVIILVALFLGGLALAADPSEALERRVKELEKANLVAQEDLGRAMSQIDTLKSALKKTQTALDEEIAARKALGENLNTEIAARKALEEKVTLVAKQLSDLAAAQAAFQKASQDADAALGKRIDDTNGALSVLTKTTADQLAALRDALEKERAERIAADQENAKQTKKNRTITYVLSGLLGIGVVAK